MKHYKIRCSRACRLFGLSRTSVYYKKKMPIKDASVKQLIIDNLKYNDGRQIVTKKIQNKHSHISTSKIRRVYVKYGFSLFKRLKSKRIKRVANPIKVPLAANEEWAIDFMSDALSNGRRIRTLNIIDQYNRKCLGIQVLFNLPANQVIRYLDQVIERNGKPKSIRTDNGTEFTSKRFQKWLYDRQIIWSPIRSGCPQENSIIERMNRTFREDVLDANIFENIMQVQQHANDWVKYYNEERPHLSLNMKSPINYAI